MPNVANNFDPKLQAKFLCNPKLDQSAQKRIQPFKNFKSHKIKSQSTKRTEIPLKSKSTVTKKVFKLQLLPIRYLSYTGRAKKGRAFWYDKKRP